MQHLRKMSLISTFFSTWLFVCNDAARAVLQALGNMACVEQDMGSKSFSFDVQSRALLLESSECCTFRLVTRATN
jgi:hypothetical protein